MPTLSSLKRAKFRYEYAHPPSAAPDAWVVLLAGLFAGAGA